MIVSTGFIMLMQVGFAMLENGTVRAKNSKSILIKNIIDVSLGAIIFYCFGFGLAFGLRCIENCGYPEEEKMSKYIGTKYFAGHGFDENKENMYIKWCFEFSFCATAATIVSGSLAERTRFRAYLIFSVLMTGFIYPMIVAWTWGGGWLK